MPVFSPQQQSTLVDRIRRGEPAAEEELVRAFSNRVMFLVLARTRDREAAADLTQEILLAVVLALRNSQVREAERLAAFVYGTARNLINNYLRSRSRQPRQDSIDAALEVPSGCDPVEDQERVALVHRAVGALEKTDRQILMLTLGEGLKPGEIAARLGMTSEVVRTRKSRALKKIITHVKNLSRT